MKHKSIVWSILTSFTMTLSPSVVGHFIAEGFWLIKPWRRTRKSLQECWQRSYHDVSFNCWLPSNIVKSELFCPIRSLVSAGVHLDHGWIHYELICFDLWSRLWSTLSLYCGHFLEGLHLKCQPFHQSHQRSRSPALISTQTGIKNEEKHSFRFSSVTPKIDVCHLRDGG